MHILYDEDEYETIITHKSCTSCGGNLGKCRGIGCNGNGSISIGSRRRDPSEVKKIKEERQLEYENKILAEAEVIKARRGLK